MTQVTADLTFSARLWEHTGDSPWVFVTVPVENAQDLRDSAPATRGFGSIKVRVTIGETLWDTSVFPDKGTGSFLLPIKRSVRDRERLQPGDLCEIRVQPIIL